MKLREDYIDFVFHYNTLRYALYKEQVARALSKNTGKALKPDMDARTIEYFND